MKKRMKRGKNPRKILYRVVIAKYVTRRNNFIVLRGKLKIVQGLFHKIIVDAVRLGRAFSVRGPSALVAGPLVMHPA